MRCALLAMGLSLYRPQIKTKVTRLRMKEQMWIIDPISVEVGKIYFVSATVTATSTGTFKNADWGIILILIQPNSKQFHLLNEQDAYENGVETNVYGTVIPNQSTIGVVFMSWRNLTAETILLPYLTSVYQRSHLRSNRRHPNAVRASQ